MKRIATIFLDSQYSIVTSRTTIAILPATKITEIYYLKDDFCKEFKLQQKNICLNIEELI